MGPYFQQSPNGMPVCLKAPQIGKRAGALGLGFPKPETLNPEGVGLCGSACYALWPKDLQGQLTPSPKQGLLLLAPLGAWNIALRL